MERRIAVFASGSGSNAENLIAYFNERKTGKVVLVLSNKAEAGVLERTQRMGVLSRVFSSADWKTGEAILRVLREEQVDFIVLAGFLLRVPDMLLHAYPNRIVNIHPSLLPRHGGKGMYGDRVHQAVIEQGDTETGITIHYINEHYDEGNVIFQATCPVHPGDTYQDVAARVHQLEYQYYPHIVEQLLQKVD